MHRETGSETFSTETLGWESSIKSVQDFSQTLQLVICQGEPPCQHDGGSRLADRSLPCRRPLQICV